MRFRGALSAFFAVVSGLKQGDPLAPILFNFCLEWIVGDLHEDQLNPAELRRPLILAFADDIAIVAASKEELVRVATVIKQRAARFGLLISPKTEYMVVARQERPEHGAHLTVDGVRHKKVPQFRCLGVTITPDNNMDAEISSRRAAGLRQFHSLAHLFRSQRIPRQAKSRLYSSIVRPAMLYGCEAWVLTAGRESKVAAAENTTLRRIAGPVWHEGLQKTISRPNAEVRELSGVASGVNLAKKRSLQYAGHVARGSVPPNALAMLVAPPPAKRFRGSPRKSLAKQRADNTAAVGTDPANWRETAEDRDAFRAAIKFFDGMPDPHEERRQAARERRAAREQQQDQQQDLDAPDPTDGVP